MFADILPATKNSSDFLNLISLIQTFKQFSSDTLTKEIYNQLETNIYTILMEEDQSALINTLNALIGLDNQLALEFMSWFAEEIFASNPQGSLL